MVCACLMCGVTPLSHPHGSSLEIELRAEEPGIVTLVHPHYHIRASPDGELFCNYDW